LKFDEVIHLPRRWRFDIVPTKKLAHIIEEHNIEQIFVLGFFTFFFARLAMLRVHSSAKIYVSIHATKPGSLKVFVQNWIMCRMIRQKDQIISVCKAQAIYWSKCYQKQLKQFITIYNGVDTNCFIEKPYDIDKSSLRSLKGIPPDAIVILQVAAFRKEKRQIESVRALAFLHEQSSVKPFLVFVGKGETIHEYRVRKEVLRLGLTGFVKFCGAQEDTRRYYWIADIFTLSSNAVETFSLAALEAMACGTPCVLTDLGGAREMIKDGYNGYVVPVGAPKSLADAWKNVIEMKLMLDSHGIRDIVLKNFSLRKMTTEYKKLLYIDLDDFQTDVLDAYPGDPSDV
jgi:glycosyltransferase involved in cell wall biosynthesis